METPSTATLKSRMTRTDAKRGLDWRFPRSQTYPINQSWQKEGFSQCGRNRDSAFTAPELSIRAHATMETIAARVRCSLAAVGNESPASTQETPAPVRIAAVGV